MVRHTRAQRTHMHTHAHTHACTQVQHEFSLPFYTYKTYPSWLFCITFPTMQKEVKNEANCYFSLAGVLVFALFLLLATEVLLAELQSFWPDF